MSLAVELGYASSQEHTWGVYGSGSWIEWNLGEKAENKDQSKNLQAEDRLLERTTADTMLEFSLKSLPSLHSEGERRLEFSNLDWCSGIVLPGTWALTMPNRGAALIFPTSSFFSSYGSSRRCSGPLAIRGTLPSRLVMFVVLDTSQSYFHCKFMAAADVTHVSCLSLCTLYHCIFFLKISTTGLETCEKRESE